MEKGSFLSDLTVAKLWRYPVKSMQGESLTEVEVTPAGLKLDRTWAVRDEESETIRGAKYLPNLLLCSARYLDRLSDAGVPHVEVTLPNGRAFVSDDPKIHAQLSELVNRRVALWPLQPVEDLKFYRNHALGGGDILNEFRKQFGLMDGEPLPTMMNDLPLDVLKSAAEFSAPPGSFFDGPTLNILTESSLRALQKSLPNSIVAAERFRPNVLVADSSNLIALVEEEWVGRSLSIGESARASITMKCPRCVMVSHPMLDMPRDTSITRTLVRDFDFCLSVYGSIEQGGRIAVGDSILVHDMSKGGM